MCEENWDIFTHVESSMKNLKDFVEAPVNQNKDLSSLNLSYAYENFPDYSDDQIQSCYMIRNGFGYDFKKIKGNALLLGLKLTVRCLPNIKQQLSGDKFQLILSNF